MERTDDARGGEPRQVLAEQDGVPPPILSASLSPREREVQEIRELCASRGLSEFAGVFVDRKLSLWQVQGAILQILGIIVGPKVGSWGHFQYDRRLELDILERQLRQGLAHRPASPPGSGANDLEAEATAATKFADALRAGTKPAPVDSELERWFGRDLDADPHLTLLASPRLAAVLDHDALAAQAAKVTLAARKKRDEARRRFLGKPAGQKGMHIAGDRTATCRGRSRAARPYYLGATRYPHVGRFFDLAVAEYLDGGRAFRKRLRLVLAAHVEHPASSLIDRARMVRHYLLRLHPGSTWEHVARVLERHGNDLGGGDLAAKINRLQVKVSNAKRRRLSSRRANKPKAKGRLKRRRRARTKS